MELPSENAKARCLHAGVCASTVERAEKVFEDLFGFERIKDFQAPPELMDNLFGVNESVRVMVYDAGPIMLEVFVSPAQAGRTGGYTHLCLAIADKEALIRNAADAGFAIRRHERPDGSHIVFLRDEDGNLYEIKEL